MKLTEGKAQGYDTDFKINDILWVALLADRWTL